MLADERVGGLDEISHLRQLAHELGSRGLDARVIRARADGTAFLRVVNPRAASLSENVTCAKAPEDRDHYFWWSWGERMHRVSDPEGAATKVGRVLAVRR